MSAAEILEQIRRLPEEEQRKVVESIEDEYAYLGDSLLPEDAAELDRRAEDALKHPGRGKPVEQVFVEIRDRFKR